MLAAFRGVCVLTRFPSGNAIKQNNLGEIWLTWFLQLDPQLTWWIQMKSRNDKRENTMNKNLYFVVKM